MNIFYCPSALLNEECTLDENESGHITRVLRKKVDEELYVFDGKGNLFDARIVSTGKKHVNVHVVRLIKREENDKPALHIAIAPSKNIERFEWFVEKATEIGVTEITPLLCQHSERREFRRDRIEKVLLNACKQSLKLTIPRLNDMMKFGEFITSIPPDTRKYIAFCEEDSMHLKDAYHGGFDAVVLIGPEGDFTKEEVLVANTNGFETVSLGKSRLRLETAGIYVSALFDIVNGK